jgi:hypothetical protein
MTNTNILFERDFRRNVLSDLHIDGSSGQAVAPVHNIDYNKYITIKYNLYESMILLLHVPAYTDHLQGGV